MNKEKRDPMDGDYVGNIFGPRVSIVGAVVIVGLLAFVLLRHWYLDVPLGFEDPLAPEEEQVEFVADSLQLDTIGQMRE
ncbi:MAG: hypothetical protein AAFU03_04225 [Bacteroidota bacterium]